MRTPPTTVEEQNHKLYFELTLKSNQTEYTDHGMIVMLRQKNISVLCEHAK